MPMEQWITLQVMTSKVFHNYLHKANSPLLEGLFTVYPSDLDRLPAVSYAWFIKQHLYVT